MTNRDEPCEPRGALLFTALAPVLPHLIGSVFNIWYNISVIKPLLTTPALEQQFRYTVIGYNAVVYPLAVGFWISVVFSLRAPLEALANGRPVDESHLAVFRRRLIHLPWWGAVISGAAWFLCIPVFLLSLMSAADRLDDRLLWHLPISFIVSGCIAVTHSFFLVELASHRRLFPIFFRSTRADQTPGAYPLSLRGRGLLWAVSASVCPIVSLLLLSAAPTVPNTPQFALFVGIVGIAFSVWSAWLINRLVAEPVDQLRKATQSVASGQLDVWVPLRRADEFGTLVGEFNRMIDELRGAEHLRQTFGLHVGRRVAERLMSRELALGGVEEIVTVMFVDIRGFTARSADRRPQEVVAVLNEFLRVMVEVVEKQHGGMINKFLGDGFMALFGVEDASVQADAALTAAIEMQKALECLNTVLEERGEARLAIGIGLHTGPAVIGSIGSPERMEFTAIGNTVNVASRLESTTKVLGVPLLFTDAVRTNLKNMFALRSLPPQAIRGVAESVTVWTLME